LFDFIEIRNNSTTIESLRHLDELENLHYLLNNENDKNDLNQGGWGFPNTPKNDSIFQALMTNAKDDGTLENSTTDPEHDAS
jgi:hypothetical protein